MSWLSSWGSFLQSISFPSCYSLNSNSCSLSSCSTCLQDPSEQLVQSCNGVCNLQHVRKHYQSCPTFLRSKIQNQEVPVIPLNWLISDGFSLRWGVTYYSHHYCWTNGWCSSWAAVSRRLGFFCRQSFRKFFALSERFLGISGLSLPCASLNNAAAC